MFKKFRASFKIWSVLITWCEGSEAHIRKILLLLCSVMIQIAPPLSPAPVSLTIKVTYVVIFLLSFYMSYDFFMFFLDHHKI